MSGVDELELDYALLEAWLREPAPVAERSAIGEARARFHAALVGWFAGRELAANLAELDRVFAELEQGSASEACRHLWRLGRGVVEALSDGGLGADKELKLLFGRLDRQIKTLEEVAEGPAEPPAELIQGLGAALARATSEGPRVTALRTELDLGELPLRQPSETTSGPHAARLLQTVAGAIQDQLAAIEQTLDRLVGGQSADPRRLRAHADSLTHMADTLAMLRLSLPQRAAEQQAAIFRAMAEGGLTPGEGELLELARALLFLGHTLDAIIGSCADLEDRGDRVLAALARIRDGVAGGLGLGAPSSQEHLRAGTAALREACIDMAKVEDAVRAFHDSPWEREQLAELPGLLQQIRGALLLVGEPHAAEQLRRLAGYLGGELLGRGVIPARGELDRLVGLVEGFGHYLEAARDRRSDGEDALAAAEAELDRLTADHPLPGALSA